MELKPENLLKKYGFNPDELSEKNKPLAISYCAISERVLHYISNGLDNLDMKRDIQFLSSVRTLLNISDRLGIGNMNEARLKRLEETSEDDILDEFLT